MSIRRRHGLFGLILAVITGIPVAHAQFAVIDIAAVTQLITQVQTLEQELSTVRSHLEQARAEYQSITGPRGMEKLLAGVDRNYLPGDWTQLTVLARGSSALSAQIHDAINANTVLTPEQAAMLSPAERSQLEAQRQYLALQQVVARQALATTSSRFASIQQLIDAIPAAGDQKAILDLQARIATEEGMLANDQTKIHALDQSIQAERWANEQRARELVVAGHGRFDARFRPAP